MTYSVSSTPTYLVDHEHLSFLVNQLGRPDARAVVVGFGEYAKHLVNYHPEKIAAIYDPSEAMHGVRFRNVEVTGADNFRAGINMILAAEYGLLYDYLPKIIDLYPGVPFFVPPRMHYKPSNDINVFEQENIYKILHRDGMDAPPTMMSKEKINFLLEILRFGLTKAGCVVEMGSWQGGSTWFIAKTLAYLKEKRSLYMMDLFEDHMMDPTATMCTEEIRRRMQVYDRVTMIKGLVDDLGNLAQIREPDICFAHMDLGPQPTALEYLWDHLSPGAPLLLDNYGHLLAPPWGFERIIEARGGRIIRLPWSEQGLALKPC